MKCEMVNRVRAATLGSVLISILLCSSETYNELLEVTWGTSGS